MCHIVTRRPNEPRTPPEPAPDPRKERVLHTRVPERLEAELKERAAALGVSVSNLVRNVLTHTFGLVGDIVADGAQVARSAGGTARRGAPPAVEPEGGEPDDDVIGWQPLVLHKNAVCIMCNQILPRGSEAAVAVVLAGPRPILCPPCAEELRHAP